MKPPLLMVGVDGGIGPVAFGFGRKRIDQPAAEMPPRAGRNNSIQRLKGVAVRRKQMVLAGRRRRPVTGQKIEKKMYSELAQIVKYNGSQTGDDADQDKLNRPLAGSAQNQIDRSLSANFERELVCAEVS